MNRFKKLIVWQKSMVLAEEVYQLTGQLPGREKFGLVLQLNRNAVSIPSNIAEGAGRNSNKEYCRFLSIAQGSTFELETQLLLCVKLKYLVDEQITKALQLITQIQNMIYALQLKLK